MKILIIYYSEMGNIEKMARVIKNAIEKIDVDLIPIKEVDPISLIASNLIFLGSGIYGFKVNRKITKLIKKAPELCPYLDCYSKYDLRKKENITNMMIFFKQ